MKIVVIEDEIRIREGIGGLLHKLDTEYELAGTAENGRQGLELIRQTSPDVVIADIRMPVLDGLQMLSAAVEEGFTGKAVILSAYTEFEYARQAIRLGVSEYLIKPVVVNELSQALQRIRLQIEEEQKQRKLKTRPEQLFSGILWSGLNPDEKVSASAWEQLGICRNEPVAMICIYLGSSFGQEKERLKRELTAMKKEPGAVGGCMLENDREQMLYLFLYGYEEAHGLERWFQTWLFERHRKYGYPMSAGWVEAEGIEQVKSRLETLQRYMDWSITLGTDILISWPKVTRLQTAPCVYPVEIENHIKGAVCAADEPMIRRYMEEFHRYFQTGVVYGPREIKECYVRFLWAVMNIAKEIGLLENGKIQQQKLLELVMSARLFEELKEAANVLLYGLKPRDGEGIIHLTVKKACGMIHEYYQSGITLEEIAGKLNLTPEYLGSRFHKEMGVTFSSYIRDYRIGKAKELLLGTSLKLYEIAEKVGYSDAKYFSRVFREATGQLPADYRRTHR